MDPFIFKSAQRCLALMYHDVIPAAACDRKGRVPRGTDPYKIGEPAFRAHLEAIQRVLGNRAPGRADAPAIWLSRRPVFLTFDDGDESAHTLSAGLLDGMGWAGHFFITTDLIGRRGFLNRAQILDLHRRGHVIGSHSCSHPVPMSRCTREAMRREWRDSVAVLEDITGAKVRMASVPGGYYSRDVAETAIECGIEMLFTSEPTGRITRIDGCLLLGRYALKHGMGPGKAAAFASGRLLPRWKEAAWWNTKKLLKRANVRAYIRVRDAMLGA